MKKQYIGILFFLTSLTYAQVGINTKIPLSTSSLHIDGAKDNGATPIGSLSVSQITNDMVFTNTGILGLGTLTPNANTKADTRYTPNINFADSYIAVGQTTQAATAAGAGAIRYNPTNGGRIQYSDGTNWSDLTAYPGKVIVTANAQAVQPTTRTTDESNPIHNTIKFEVEVEDNYNAYEPTTGIFTAPRDGIYLVFSSWSQGGYTQPANSYAELQYIVNGDTANPRQRCLKAITSTTRINTNPTGQCLAGVKMNRGDELTVGFVQTIGSYNFRTKCAFTACPPGNNNDHGFVNLSITEQ